MKYNTTFIMLCILFTGKRIDESEIKTALERLSNSNPLKCYICGPPPMIADMEAILRNLGIKDSDVFCEKWW